MQLSHQQIHAFQETVWGYYRQHGRGDLPWRQAGVDGSFNPYHILVSELMLQQTQVTRVVPKYSEFIARFPSVQALANSSLGDVLRAWQGLGYNRRAKFLWLAAQKLAELGSFPKTEKELITLPGVGPNTAGAILAYSHNTSTVFIETNIRTVYIHCFFDDQTDVSDKEIAALVEQTLETEQPREWYWALMDYGTFIKATHGNKSRASKSYAKQSAFHGSRRQVRGQIIRLLGERPYARLELTETIADERAGAVLQELAAEGLIREKQGIFSLD